MAASPRDGHYRQNLALALLEAGRASEAATHAQHAVGLVPAEPGGHYVLARVLAARGRIEAAA